MNECDLPYYNNFTVIGLALQSIELVYIIHSANVGTVVPRRVSVGINSEVWRGRIERLKAIKKRNGGLSVCERGGISAIGKGERGGEIVMW